ncbi:MAG TPA: helix-turn-helix domain-containing protein [Acidimicrobiales bacterium]
MTSPSPPTDRVVRVLDLLGNHPGEPMSFTDIARRLELSRATCHAVLTSLTDAGYVLRNDDKTFLLGPSLIALGRSAERSYPHFPAVRSIIAELAAETNRSCVLTAVNGAVLTVLGYEGKPPQGEHSAAGNRIPFAAPFGVAHAAWATEDAVRQWVDRGAEIGAGRFEQTDQLLTEVRKRGFSVSPLERERRQLWELFELVQKGLLSDDLRQLIARSTGPIGHDYLWEEINRPTVPVSSISTPVFSAPGRTTFVIHLEVLDNALPRAELRRLAGRLVATAQRCSEQIAELTS